MEHLNGISEAQYLEAVNAFWHFYKAHAHDYPNQFKLYIADTSLRSRLLYYRQDDRWLLMQVSSYSQKSFSHSNTKNNDNPTSNNARNKYSTGIVRKNNNTMRYLLKR